jgi:hypothetical protein
MTKKDYELIAKILNDTRPYTDGLINQDDEKAQWVIMRNRFAEKLRETNPRFDRQRFIAATEE